MLTTSLFLCHNVDQTEQKETQILDLLYLKLQDEGAKIADYPGSPAEEGFQAFLQQQLPRCQWFILFQTPAITSLPAVRQAVNTALKMVEQHQMEGVIRVIAAPSAPQEVPPEWSSLPTYDATYDFERASEKLLLHLAGDEGKGGPPLFGAPSRAPITTIPLAARTGSISAPTAAPPAFSGPLNTPSIPFDFDRPPVPPSSMARFGKALHNGYQDVFYERKRLVVILSVLLVLVLLGSGLGFYLTRPAAPANVTAKPVAQVPTYGQVYFVSTDMAIVQATTHTLDSVEVNLQNLKQPAQGNSYYAWLLPDAATENGSSILLSQFTPQSGAAHFTYQSSIEKNLLSTDSRFAITEESSSPVPDVPSPDHSKWRYQGEFPQTPGITDSSHLSALDHLRHLLVEGPTSMMDEHSPELPGGLGVWLLQNVHLIFELAADARGINNAPSQARINADCVEILDLLDGKDYVNNDVPQNTPWLAGSTIANKPILSMDPNAMVPGYIHDIESHLLGITVSPGVLQSQQTLAGKIDEDLNSVEHILTQAHDLAKQLVSTTTQQSPGSNVIPQLDTLASESMDAYSGQLDPTTGSRTGGVISIYDHLQQLAQFSVYQYSA